MTQALAQPAASQLRRSMPSAPRWRRYVIGYGLVAPAIALVLGMFVYPLVYEVQLSLTDTRATDTDVGEFVGLANYTQLLADHTVWEALRNTTFLVVVTSGAELLLGLAVALLLWRRSWLRPLLFVMVFVPWVYPSSFANYTWYWMILPPFHTFYTLQAIQARFWLEGIFGEQAWQILSFALVGIWRGSSIIGLVLLAGLRAIPSDLLEYARLEISNPFRYLWSVVLPLARRFFALAALVGVTVTYLDYLAMYIESNGRITVPVLGTLVYKAEMVDGLSGYAAALSLTQLPVVIVLLLVVLPLVESQVSRRKVPEAPGVCFDPHPPTPLSLARERGDTGGSGLYRTWGGVPAREQSRSGGYRSNALLSLACLAVAAFYLLPLYYTAVQSVKSRDDFLGGPGFGQPFWPFELDFQDGWADTFGNPVFWQAALTTLIVFGSVVVVGAAVSLLAAYALARLRLPAAEWLSRVLFATYFIPQLAVVVPLLIAFSNIGLSNTVLGIVLVYLTLAIPFGTWLFYIYFLALDPEAEEHALLDGTRLRVFWSVVLPRAWPVVTAAAIFAIGMMSSDLLYARVFTLTGDTRTLPATMGSMVYDPDTWADANAAILAGAIPIVLAGLALGRYYLRGLQAAFTEENAG